MQTLDQPQIGKRTAIVVSVVIILHLAAITAGALAAPSGPWAMGGETNMATPPQFAFDLRQIADPYLQATRFTSHYRFATNRPANPGAYLEAKLYDAEGKEIGQRRIPDKSANRWVRHRQDMLVRHFTEDQPFMPPMTEFIAAPSAAPPTADIWDMVEMRKLQLRPVPMHLVARDRPVFRPSDWSLVVARSLGRYLAHSGSADRVELIRYSQEPIPPAVLFMDNIPGGAFDVLTSAYGAVR